MARKGDEMAEENGYGVRFGPPWIQALLRWGPTAAIAGFLVWFLAGTMDTRMSAMERAIQQHMIESAHDRAELRYIMQQICWNTAKTETEARSCGLKP
jgi:hypothetical protein